MNHITELITADIRRKSDLIDPDHWGRIMRCVASNYTAGDLRDDVLRAGAKWSLVDEIKRAIRDGGRVHAN